MEFFFAVFFLLFYYLRPQDWVPGLAGANLVKPIIGLWMLVLITNRSRPAALSGVLRTPHDWLILIYFGYVVFTAPDAMDAMMGFLPLAAFYALTVQSVNAWPRVLSYLKWWNLALAVVALLAVLSLWGIDLTGAKEYTERFLGRLSLGTWLHNNPNALGHSVVVIIPLSYFLFFWRGDSLGRFVLFPLFAGLAYYCAYKTESKGAFLVGGTLIALIFVAGRPKFVQGVAIVTALTLGISALSFLPRMSEMNNLRADEGVQGRLLAWEMARNVSRKDATGEGWHQFVAYIDWMEGNRMIYDIPKATHSSYVKVGADLGRYGLFIYLAALWCACHTLLTFKPQNELEDRCLRALIILIAANLISGWMINREYHIEYFLLIATTAALHRLRRSEDLARAANEPASDPGAPDDAEADSSPPTDGNGPRLPKRPDPVPAFSIEKVSMPGAKPLWNRFGWIDACICAGLTWLTFWTWDYILENI